MSKQKQNRVLLGALALASSAAALGLSATNVEAAEWHTQWGANPVITPNPDHGDAYANCQYSLPAGQPASYAYAGVHFNHTWLELKNWQGNLGYSPEAMSYYLCTNHQGASTWVSSQFVPLWYTARKNPYTNGYDSSSADIPCPSDYFWIVGAFCQTRAWW